MKLHFAGLAMLSMGVAWAAPITVTEPPDLPGSGGLTHVLDARTNIVSGFVNGSPYGADYEDNFFVSLPKNLQVTSVFLWVTNFSNIGGAAGMGCFTGAGCFGAGLGGSLSNPATGSTTSYTATSPWADSPAGGVNIGSFNWALTIEVLQLRTAVPEPARFGLAVPALAAMAALLRRRAARREEPRLLT